MSPHVRPVGGGLLGRQNIEGDPPRSQVWHQWGRTFLPGRCVRSPNAADIGGSDRTILMLSTPGNWDPEILEKLSQARADSVTTVSDRLLDCIIRSEDIVRPTPLLCGS